MTVDDFMKALTWAARRASWGVVVPGPVRLELEDWVVYFGLEDLPSDMPRTKCDEAGFKHAWKEVEPSGRVYLTAPPMYDPPMERCANCGLLRILHVEHRETWRYDTR